MKYLHTMVRVTDVDASLRFYRDGLGLKEIAAHRERGRPLHAHLPRSARARRMRRSSSPSTGTRRSTPAAATSATSPTRSTTSTTPASTCMDTGVTINRPPRDGRMAFVRSPDNISIEILQDGPSLAPAEPWPSMPNTGKW